MKRLAGVATVFFSTACVSVTPEGAKVRITGNPQVVAGCKFLGDFKAVEGGDERIKNKTAEMHGDTAFVVPAGSDPVTKAITGADQRMVRAEVYRCETPEGTAK